MPKIFLATLVFIVATISPLKAYAANLAINEFSAHPSSGNKEWVEFYNPDNINLSTYWLDDDTDFNSDSGSSAKKSLSTINTSNNSYPYLEFSSFLNNGGDYVVLFSPDGSIIDQYQYTDDPAEDVTIGRSPDGSGSFVSLESSTKGLANSQPLPEPSPSPSSQTSSKSPSPTPTSSSSKSTATSKPLPKTSPSPKTVLGEKVESHEIIASNSALEINSPSPSPSPVLVEDQKTKNPKIPLMMAGIGIILIGLSGIFYLWTRRNSNKVEKEDEKTDSI